jgi:isoquinoline 1-oxidoreductase beta subunit
MDQLAVAAGQDPLSFRLKNLGEDSRYKGVLDLVAKKANWSGQQPDGRIKGMAVHKSFGTYIAQVSDLSLTPNGDFKVDKVVCVVDCGLAINPDIIKAQMEGGIGYGLSPALMSEITIKNGAVVESNFDAHKVLRIQDMPDIEVYIVPSARAPTGVGEPSTPVIAPSIANALFSKIGKPQKKLPLSMKL